MTGEEEGDIPEKPSAEAVEKYRERIERKPKPMDLESMGNAGSTARDTPVQRCPDVDADSPPTQQEKEEQNQARNDRMKISASLIWLRAKFLLFRVVQLVGFALALLAAYVMLGPAIEAGGLSLDFLPTTLIRDVYLQIGLSPVLLLVIGSITIWLTTSTSR
ncbi:hypothetical protein [Haloferax sp. KTX1]|uniref:hypothetical protein n=1 Tax=Haloferax sp. KTX1 TaxID=2600597 RepID=UPI0011DCEE84|nr:hypothetical protein [Haloferax sp. KTX1]